MTHMFPTMVSDPGDRNRRFTGEVGDTAPRSLRVGYALLLVAAVIMLVIGFAQLAVGAPENFDPNSGSKFMYNVRMVAFGDIIFAAALTFAAAYVLKGSKTARRWAGAIIGLASFLNLLGFFLGVAGWASFVVVIVMVIALFFIFRPDANAFVDKQSGNLWLGVK